MSDRSPRYTAIAIALHWAIAIAIVFMIWLGWNMHENEAWIQFHKSIGITILILTIARIIWRLLNPPPALPAGMKPLEKTASHVIHIGFYALMLALPLTGWLLVSTSFELDVPTVLFGAVSWPDIPGLGFLKNEAAHEAVEFVHAKLSWLILGLLALHVAGALKHEFTDEEGVLKRILPGLFGQTAPPHLPPSGFVAAFGAAFAVFAVIAGSPVITAALKPAPQAVAASFASSWDVDHDASSIAFSGLYEGNPFTGSFGTWQATIDFDPQAPELGRVLVSVHTGTVSTNQKLYTDSLKSPEWFHVAAHPVAAVEITNISPAQQGFDATANLTIKGISVEVPFTFRLEIDGDTATMAGHATLQRRTLDLGQKSDPGGEWVGEDVRVDVTMRALRSSGPNSGANSARD